MGILSFTYSVQTLFRWGRKR